MDPLMFLALGIVIAIFVGLNVGGSSTGVCFGPVVGSDLVSMRQAGALMSVSAFAGGVLVGPSVVDTLGSGLVPESVFTPVASLAVLLFIGIGLLVSNYAKISASTSNMAVLAIAALGVVLGALDWSTFGLILTWWVASAVLAFWLSAVIGRYLYDDIVATLELDSGSRRHWARIVAIGMACYMAFSAGASNVANAVAPLVGSGQLGMLDGVILAGVAIAGGAFLIGPRTMDTIGNDITDMTLEAALIIMFIAATIVVFLSNAGIPVSLAHVATVTVLGLGWGRATKRVPLQRGVGIDEMTREDKKKRKEDALDLYNLNTARKVIKVWVFVPIGVGAVAIAVFGAAVYLGLL